MPGILELSNNVNNVFEAVNSENRHLFILVPFNEDYGNKYKLGGLMNFEM